ncbi:MAG: GFA family protein [Myxococcota bacterium]|nr:GFA family protein [Myxococcota bacterium]
MTQTKSEPRTYRGGCHCGGLRVEADLNVLEPASPYHAACRCNCTFCRRRGAVTMLIPPSAFRVIEARTEARYVPKPEVGAFVFCAVCGVHVYGTGHMEMLGGDFVTVNLDALDEVPRAEVQVGILDGRDETWTIVGQGPLIG